MSDETKIEPALTSEQWQSALENEFVMQDMAKRFATGKEGTTAGLIALLNAMMRDDNPRKITRDKIEELRICVHAWGGMQSVEQEADNVRFLDALASYLPPEGT